MCDPVSLSLAAVGLGSSILISNKQNKKAQKQTNAQINAANQAAQKQIDLNKRANSAETTETVDTTADELKRKLNASQKVPLNTQNTGATIGSQSSVGLNLGGY